MANILVIDDDISYAEVMRDFLIHKGHAVRWAADGISAQVHLKAATPDLIILDNMMPGGMGSEVFSRLNISPTTSSIPVLFISGTDFEELKAQVRESARVRFLPKPVNFQKLEAMLAELLR